MRQVRLGPTDLKVSARLDPGAQPLPAGVAEHLADVRRRSGRSHLIEPENVLDPGITHRCRPAPY